MHHSPLILTMVGGLGLAFIFGLAAKLARLSPLIGYLVAGAVLGPYASPDLVLQLAEIGVVLLMFSSGLHFSADQLLSVRGIAIPGALAQMFIVGLLGMLFAAIMGWSVGAGIVFGLALSVSSTAVVLKVMQERQVVESERGRIIAGWLVVEDLAMVLVLVLLPALAGVLGGRAEPVAEPAFLPPFLTTDSLAGAVFMTLVKVAGFVALMYVVGRRAIPWLLAFVAGTGSRELFRLAVIATALVVAFGSAYLFGVSFALGAFFAGMVLAETDLSQQAARETMSVRDAFTVLFFVSVGMMFHPITLLQQPLPVLAAVLVVVIGNAAAAYMIARLLKMSNGSALFLAAALPQIGEFSFIISSLGIHLHLLPESGRDLILVASILSIMVNPLLFKITDALTGKVTLPSPGISYDNDTLTDHAVILGFGRVGRLIARGLRDAGAPFIVVEQDQEIVDGLMVKGIPAICAKADDPDLGQRTRLAQARWLISAIPDPLQTGSLMAQARLSTRNIEIIARAHSDNEVAHLREFDADFIMQGEREIALGMTDYVLRNTENGQNSRAFDKIAPKKADE